MSFSGNLGLVVIYHTKVSQSKARGGFWSALRYHLVLQPWDGARASPLAGCILLRNKRLLNNEYWWKNL